jgi:hypothetical protein
VLLRTQSSNYACWRHRVGAEAAQTHNMSHAALADRCNNRLALAILLRAVVGRPPIRRKQGVDRIRAVKRVREKRGIGELAGAHLGGRAFEFCKFAARPPQRAN